MNYANDHIRNVLVAGHGGAGKTSLVEAMLYLTKATDRQGRVEDGNTVCDFDPEEAKRHVSLSLAVAPVEYAGVKLNLIDVPGLFDFEAGLYEGMPAAESVMVVVSARSGLSAARSEYGPPRGDARDAPAATRPLSFMSAACSPVRYAFLNRIHNAL